MNPKYPGGIPALRRRLDTEGHKVIKKGKRYLVKDQTGQPTENPEELFWRVATVVAEADARYGANENDVERPLQSQP